MAKNNLMPMPTGNSSVLPKLITTAVVLALLVIVVKHPGDAATWVRALAGGAVDVIDGMASFIRQVAN